MFLRRIGRSRENLPPSKSRPGNLPRRTSEQRLRPHLGRLPAIIYPSQQFFVGACVVELVRAVDPRADLRVAEHTVLKRIRISRVSTWIEKRCDYSRDNRSRIGGTYIVANHDRGEGRQKCAHYD